MPEKIASHRRRQREAVRIRPMIYRSNFRIVFTVLMALELMQSPLNASPSSLCALKWSASLNGAAGEPAISASRGVLLLTQGASLLAVGAQDGKTLWRVNLLPEISIAMAASGQGGQGPNIFSPVVAGGIALVAYCNGPESRLLALDITTGKTRWEFNAASAGDTDSPELSGPILSPPFPWRDRVIFRTARGLTAVRLSDGDRLWKVPMDANLRIPLIASAAPVGDKAVFFNSDFGVAYAFDPLTGDKIWSTPTSGVSDRGLLNVRDVRVTVAHCHPILVQGRLLTADGLGNIYSLNEKTGSVQWRVRPGGYIFQFATLGGMIYAATDHGLYQLDPNTGETMRAYAGTDKILRCEIIKDKAILTKFPSGWEVFDLPSWKPDAVDAGFSPRLNVVAAGGFFFLGGSPSDNNDAPTTELRGYSLMEGKPCH